MGDAMSDAKYRISDFILDSMKKLIYFLLFNLCGFVAYAMTVGHIVRDEQVEVSAKNMNLCVYSAVTLCIFILVMCAREGKSVTRKTLLIEAARADDFNFTLYYKNVIIRDIMPLFAAGVVILLPYAIMVEKFGLGYETSIFVDRIFGTNLLFMILLDPIPLGAILAVIVQNIIICSVLALYLFTYQKKVLADRMWLKDAPKQENVKLNDKNKDRYKKY